MVKYTLIPTLVTVAFLAYGCSGKPDKKNPDPSTDTISSNGKNTTIDDNDASWINQIQFGYSNEKGDLILVDSAIAPLQPSELKYALDSNGTKVSIVYKTYQTKGKNDTGRQIYFNFENAPGFLYSVDGNLNPEQTEVLCTDKFLSGRSLMKFIRSDKKGLPDDVKKKVENDKSRKVKNSSELASIEESGKIYLMEFARKKDSALASLVLVYNDHYTYYDFPAMYDKQSTWRVDDGGEFWLDGIEILAVFKKENIIEIVFDWVGAEGYNTQYIQQQGEVFKEIKTNYRYTSPL